MARRLVFSVDSVLGYRVVLSRNRWKEIVRFKHPALSGHADLLRQCVSTPELIQASTKDANVHLYYVSVEDGHLCVVVGLDSEGEHFVVTAYFTRTIKPGEQLWAK